MRSKKELEDLVKLLPKELSYTVAASGDYIYSGINLPISFELFISENSLGLKYPIGNLNISKIDAINTILENIPFGEFKHRTYGINTTKWSIWELSLKGVSKEEIPNVVQQLKKVVL
ncbi:hypothetical protein GCM10011416_01020 [Polaribacter pacificus]|uniref:Uncharacterized protein n=1 Tax=Polaribacter pacificus TaxID=1775173 RepID=A0A917HS07_9FLAO|nr:hypothetical protein [Polaribacter pacificus]GGG88555.1 hypothetical protein GCM10011416_01020 [Polaribacter pacificus]